MEQARPQPYALDPASRELFTKAQSAFLENDLEALLEMLQSTSTREVDTLMQDLEQFSPAPLSHPTRRSG